MEYAQDIAMCDGMPCDSNFTRFVGYSYDKRTDYCIKKYFSKQTREIISHKCTELLQGVHPQGKRILIPDPTICEVMSHIQESYRPSTGDIHSRYIVPSGVGPEDYVQNMIDQVIETIVSQVKTQYITEECNRKLTIWTTVLGDFNSEGLRSHAPLKINEDSMPMLFNMNY